MARYTVPEADAIDLRVTARSEGTYAGYELFLPSYFDPALRPRVYLRGNRYGEPAGDPDLVVPMVNDVYRGTVLVFARDPHAARRCVDGRWNRSEADAPTVQMCPVRYYAHCLAFLTDPDELLAAALMARPRDCYAISARYFAENETDRMAPIQRLRPIPVRQRPGAGRRGQRGSPAGVAADRRRPVASTAVLPRVRRSDLCAPARAGELDRMLTKL